MDRDHWLLISRKGDGKSTFASQMSPEYLVADFDARWEEQEENQLGKSHVVNGSLLEVVDKMDTLRPKLKDKVGSIIIDSGTSVIDTTLAAARLRAQEIADRENKKINLNDVHRLKADMMRALRGAILSYGCNSVWIFHYEDGGMNGQVKVRSTISSVEVERLKSSLNAILSIQEHKGRRGIVIQWSRYRQGAAQGQIVWDTEGLWAGVPQRLSEFIRYYTPDCGYNGNTYSPEWLLSFLNEKKGQSFESVKQLAETLEVKQWPRWFDRAGWGAYIEQFD